MRNRIGKGLLLSTPVNINLKKANNSKSNLGKATIWNIDFPSLFRIQFS